MPCLKIYSIGISEKKGSYRIKTMKFIVVGILFMEGDKVKYNNSQHSAYIFSHDTAWEL